MAQTEDAIRKLQLPTGFPLPSLVTEVSPRDEMFDSSEHYLRVGLSALQLFEHAKGRGFLREERVGQILDLPCGHGRVARILRERFPKAALTVCDLNRDGVDFCADRFSATPVYSKKNFDELHLGRTFDLIWVGSLITHLNPMSTAKFLRCMARHLSPSGLLIITSHGQAVVRRLATDTAAFKLIDMMVLAMVDEYYRFGYTYRDYERVADYGNAIIAREWLGATLAASGLSLLEYIDQGWDDFQDVLFVSLSTSKLGSALHSDAGYA
jgi:SAM-dependent methyltransferase